MEWQDGTIFRVVGNFMFCPSRGADAALMHAQAKGEKGGKHLGRGCGCGCGYGLGGYGIIQGMPFAATHIRTRTRVHQISMCRSLRSFYQKLSQPRALEIHRRPD